MWGHENRAPERGWGAEVEGHRFTRLMWSDGTHFVATSAPHLRDMWDYARELFVAAGYKLDDDDITKCAAMTQEPVWTGDQCRCQI